MNEKTQLRNTLSALRAVIPDKVQKDKLIFYRLTDFLRAEFPNVKTVFTYVSMNSEADTRRFIESADDYTLYFPYTASGVMRPVLAERRTGLYTDKQGNVINYANISEYGIADKNVGARRALPKTENSAEFFGQGTPCPYKKSLNSGQISALDITIVPLLGFNESLHRIGHGKGCYDRYFTVGGDLSGAPPDTVKIGLAYDEQFCSFTPEAYDVPLDYIITPTRKLTVGS